MALRKSKKAEEPVEMAPLPPPPPSVSPSAAMVDEHKEVLNVKGKEKGQDSHFGLQGIDVLEDGGLVIYPGAPSPVKRIVLIPEMVEKIFYAYSEKKKAGFAKKPE